MKKAICELMSLKSTSFVNMSRRKSSVRGTIVGARPISVNVTNRPISVHIKKKESIH